MNKVIKYLTSGMLYLIIWWIKAFILLFIGYLIFGDRVMDRLPTLIFFGFLIAFYTSYLLVKKINAKPFFQRLYNKMKKTNTDKKEVKENNKLTNIVSEKPNQQVTKRFISKAWLRLHIVLSIIGGCLPMIIYSIFVWEFDIYYWWSALTWPIFYWLCLLILWGISKFNTAIISKKWLSNHALINLCISIIVIIYFYNDIIVYSDGDTYRPWDDGESMCFGQLSFIIYLIILFVSVWLINGFKQDEA